jgi:hypothetical protein
MTLREARASELEAADILEAARAASQRLRRRSSMTTTPLRKATIKVEECAKAIESRKPG